MTETHTPSISVIIPVLNEAAAIPSLLEALLPLGAELVFVDGGSADATVGLLETAATEPCCSASNVLVRQGQRGRAHQMNEGAAAASGDLLVFLHADTRLPGGALEELRRFWSTRHAWGRFDVRLSGAGPAFRVIEFMMNWRSRLTGICTGDQAMFVRTSVFRSVGGFASVPLMEDIEISRRLSRCSRPLCIDRPVVTSSRRWETRGVVRTVLLMWWLRLAYFFGASPDSLVRRYYG